MFKPSNHILTQLGLTRSLAAEVGKANIRVNVIVPGYIETDMTAGTFIDLTFIAIRVVSWKASRAAPKSFLIYMCSHDARSTV